MREARCGGSRRSARSCAAAASGLSERLCGGSGLSDGRRARARVKSGSSARVCVRNIASATFWKGGGSSSRCAESAATASACSLSATALAGCLARAAAACLVCSERHVGRWMDCARRGRCSTTCSGRVRTRIRRSLPTEKSSTDCRKTQPPRT
eukprot:scaffold69924_cov48-Phaeocystis_antarctica.AAC.2